MRAAAGKGYEPDGSSGGLKRKERGMNDTIYRQEAIKTALEFTVEYLCGAFDEDLQKKLMERMNALPSAQSESCEYYALCRHGRDENKLRVRLGFCEYCNEDVDGFVTPLEKNGHAFVRFGMNGWELSLKANGWHGSTKIRYCPMCGRDLMDALKDGEQNESVDSRGSGIL